MAALVIIRNIVAIAAFVAVATLAVRLAYKAVAPGVKRLLDKRAEYYDVESMDDAEILARKYGANGNGRKGKRDA